MVDPGLNWIELIIRKAWSIGRNMLKLNDKSFEYIEII